MALAVLHHPGVKTRNALILLLVTAACSKNSSEAPPEPDPQPTTSAPSGDAAARAQTIFQQRCVPCHGASGTGDGPASASLTPKPRNYTDAAWQASVDDAYIEKIIKLGGASVGKSPAMPNNPDLPPEVVSALKDVVRSFNKK